MFDVLMAVVDDEPDWGKLPRDLSPALRTLLERCLEKDARRRLRDIGEARVLFEDLRDGRGGPPLEAPLRRTRFLIPAGALVLVALALIPFTWDARDEPARGVRRFEIVPAGARWTSYLCRLSVPAARSELK